MEPKFIFKLLGLNKEIRSNFLSNLDCYSHIQSIYSDQFRNLQKAIQDKKSIIQQQDHSIKFLKESDELRNQLMNETSEEKIKGIIFKFIVKPDLDKKLNKQKP